MQFAFNWLSWRRNYCAVFTEGDTAARPHYTSHRWRAKQREKKKNSIHNIHTINMLFVGIGCLRIDSGCSCLYESTWTALWEDVARAWKRESTSRPVWTEIHTRCRACLFRFACSRWFDRVREKWLASQSIGLVDITRLSSARQLERHGRSMNRLQIGFDTIHSKLQVSLCEIHFSNMRTTIRRIRAAQCQYDFFLNYVRIMLLWCELQKNALRCVWASDPTLAPRLSTGEREWTGEKQSHPHADVFALCVLRSNDAKQYWLAAKLSLEPWKNYSIASASSAYKHIHKYQTRERMDTHFIT